MRILIRHRSRYAYPRPAALGPLVVRLRPTTHTKARIETYRLEIGPTAAVRWQHDPYGNHVARATWPAGTRVDALTVDVELALEVRPVNPFDFFVDDRCKEVPFEYPPELRPELAPFLTTEGAAIAGGPRLERFVASLPPTAPTVPFIVEVNAAVNRVTRYVIREESGVWTPEETLTNGRGSCRDSATLLVAALRARGLAARFASGYLVQLADEGMIPGEPRGVGTDVVDLHAWAEVYLPGAGWIGLDATSGLLTGEGHIPLACAATPALAAPLEFTADTGATDVSFELSVTRLGHEARPTAPYTDAEWVETQRAGARVDAKLAELGYAVTLGGEPTFNSRTEPDLPEWNGAALGESKLRHGLALGIELRRRLAPGGLLLNRPGKWYPGESLPRWALEIVARRDGTPLWSEQPSKVDASLAAAQRFIEALAARVRLPGAPMPAYEDPWRFLQDEASLPIDVDPLKAKLTDPEERRRLAAVLERGLGEPAGFVLPISRATDGSWAGGRWEFRRGRLYLLQGDSPIGLRLPLKSLPPGQLVEWAEPNLLERDPRREKPEDDKKQAGRRKALPPLPAMTPVRTAVCVEPREGRLWVFIPPTPSAEVFFELVGEVEAVRQALGLDVALEGYGPPPSPTVFKFAVTPDPGVLEVNLPPTGTQREYDALVAEVFDAALHTGLHSEKYLLDGRMAGSGGGNHLTLGGPTALESPWVTRPDALASFLTFVQHHPSLSYLFTGLFVGPTSQAPRVDEARHDALYELELALAHLHASGGPGRPPPAPWLGDAALRDLLVDLAGNTHRAEVSIDKLYDWRTPHGRQGLVELRAFEMPPHVRMVSAQALLARALATTFLDAPYERPLVRWGQALHDRFLLPYWLWRDFEDVLAFLAARGLELPEATYRPFVELRCPRVGVLQAGDVTLEVRNALEPWPVLGEEPGQGGTSRFVDSSMERVEVRARGLVPERHVVLVNGHELPLRPTPQADLHVGGVRFRAWAPPHSLHPHLGIHHPLKFDVVDTWSERSVGACAYHVWHPEGRAFLSPPLTRFEAAARRAQRFTLEGPMGWPVRRQRVRAHADAPYTLDLRRFAIDRPMPEPEPEAEGDAEGSGADRRP